MILENKVMSYFSQRHYHYQLCTLLIPILYEMDGEERRTEEGKRGEVIHYLRPAPIIIIYRTLTKKLVLLCSGLLMRNLKYGVVRKTEVLARQPLDCSLQQEHGF